MVHVPVAKPNTDDFLFQLEVVCEAGNFLRAGLGVFGEVVLEGSFYGNLTFNKKHD